MADFRPARKPGKPGARPPSRQGPPRGGGPRPDSRPPPLKDLSARERVCEAVVRQVRRFPDLAFEDTLPIEGLDSRDAALAHFMYDQVIRRWLTIHAVVSPLLEKPIEELTPKAHAAIFVGAAQILFMDRVPLHAALYETVEWTKTRGSPGVTRLTNAVLRRVMELLPAEGQRQKRERATDLRDEIPLADGQALALNREVLPTDPIARLAAATSHPVDLLRSWTRRFGLRETRALAMHGLVTPPIILNSAHATGALPEGCRPHRAPGHHVYEGPREALEASLRDRGDRGDRGDLWVQDPASSLAVGSVTDLRPSLVIDLCAGKGTKTRQLRAAFPEARIVATDIDRVRLRVLRGAFEGDERVEVRQFDDLGEFAGRADLILLDVPCSNTGVLARRPEARYRFDRARLEKLAGLQRQIMADSLPMLRTGAGARGRLLYSTCSLDPSENEDQAKWAERWHSFRVEREHRRAPEGQPGDGAEAYSDGSYAVLLG